MKRKLYLSLLAILTSTTLSSCDLQGLLDGLGDISLGFGNKESESEKESVSDNESTPNKESSVPIYNEDRVIEINMAASGEDFELNEKLFYDFIENRRKLGDYTDYRLTYSYHDPIMIVDEIIDWEEGPDIFVFQTHQTDRLFRYGALDYSNQEKFDCIVDTMLPFASKSSKIDGYKVCYPFTIDNTYFLQYDKSVFSDSQVNDIFEILEIANNKGFKVGYSLLEAFWGGASMFTFGSDYYCEYDEDRNLAAIATDFPSNSGLNALKGMHKIMSYQSWESSTTDLPLANAYGYCATISGTWNTEYFKSEMGENYGCAPMPYIEINGQRERLGSFADGKAIGINPHTTIKDVEKYEAVHQLAEYLVSYDAQIVRYEYNKMYYPTNTKAMEEIKEYDEIANVIYIQNETSHSQNDVPGNFWSASYNLAYAIYGLEYNQSDDYYNSLLQDYHNEIVNSR